jgi:intracellular septation protein
MTDQARTEPGGGSRLLIDIGPLLVFFLVNFFAPVPGALKIFVATGAFMAAMMAALVYSAIRFRTVSPLLLFSGVMVVILGGLTIWLHDETFIKVKPTIIYALFAAVLGGGLLFGRSFIAILFDQVFNLTPQGWRLLTLRWALFFAGMAVLNEVIWRTQSTDFWVAFKAFGVIPLTMLFAIAQMPLTKRYHLEPATLEASDASDGDVSKG